MISSSPLPKSVTHFLNSSEPTERYDHLCERIASTSLRDQIQIYALVASWVKEQMTKADQPDHSKFGAAYGFMAVLLKQIPPAFLMESVVDFSWGIYQPSWGVDHVFERLNGRIQHLKPFRYPLFLRDDWFPCPSSLDDPDQEGIQRFPYSHELVNDPGYQDVCVKTFKKLLIDRAPLDVFRQLARHQNIRAMFTRAVIELLSELNSLRTATQEQLSAVFSSVFLYVHMMALSNDIDGQAFCEYLQSRPFLSSFCVLAMVNYIPMNLYLFNLLSPQSECQSGETGDSEEGQQPAYVMIDGATNTNLSQFISRMPTILENYFRGTSVLSGENDACTKTDDNEFLTYLHLSSATILSRMKSVMRVARERLLGPMHVSAMQILLLRCITLSLQRTLADCAETKMFTPSFCVFVKTVFGSLLPTFAEQLGPKFFDLAHIRSTSAELSIKGVICHLVPAILHQVTNDFIMPFCIAGSSCPKTSKCAHILMAKLLQCGHPKLTPKVYKFLEESDDILVLIQFAEALSGFDSTKTCKETEMYQKAREMLINRLPFVEEKGYPFLVLSSVKENGMTGFNERYSQMLTILSQMDETNCTKEAFRMLRAKLDMFVVLSLLTSMRFMKIKEYATVVYNALRSGFGQTTYSEDGECKFEVRPCDMTLILTENVLARFVVFGHHEMAAEILNVMDAPLQKDSAPLHWLVKFTVKYRKYIRAHENKLFDMIRRILARLQSQTGDDEFYVPREDSVFQMANVLVKKESMLIHDPDVVVREYRSPYRHAHAFAVCAEAISSKDDQEIAVDMISPMLNFYKVWPKRDMACVCLARVAADLGADIGYYYMNSLLSTSPCAMAIKACHVFLSNAGTELVRRVAAGTRELIAGDERRRAYFLDLMVPIVQRLEGADEDAAALLCGLLEGISDATPLPIQERITDIVTFTVHALSLKAHAAAILTAAQGLSPDLRRVLNVAMTASLTDDDLLPCF